MLSRESIDRKGRSGQRDNERVADWDSCYKLALKLANRYWRWYFPTMEDREQGAALAATAAIYECGAGLTLKEATRIIQRELNQQARAYGMCRVAQGPKGSRKQHRVVSQETSFARLEGRYPGVWMALERNAHAVGVGEFTRVQARLLHWLVNGFEPESDSASVRQELPTRVSKKVMQRAHQEASRERDLMRLVEAYQKATRPAERTGSALGQACGWQKDKGIQLLKEAQRRGLISHEPDPYVTLVVTAYQETTSAKERTSTAIAQKCGLSRQGTWAILKRAREQGLLVV